MGHHSTEIKLDTGFKFITVDNHQSISDEVYNFVVNHTDLLQREDQFLLTPVDIPFMLDHTPSLKDFLEKKSLKPRMMAIVVVHAECSGKEIHIDYIDTPTPTFIRLLWPVKHCTGSVTKLYNIPQECLEEVSQPNGIVYYNIIDYQRRQYLCEFELRAPVVFDVSKAHEVHTAPGITEHRISFTIGFEFGSDVSKSFDAWS